MFFITCTTAMAPMKKRAEKECGKKKEMITVEVKSNSMRLWRIFLSFHYFLWGNPL
jgi:hypothetical protein